MSEHTTWATGFVHISRTDTAIFVDLVRSSHPLNCFTCAGILYYIDKVGLRVVEKKIGCLAAAETPCQACPSTCDPKNNFSPTIHLTLAFTTVSTEPILPCQQPQGRPAGTVLCMVQRRSLPFSTHTPSTVVGNYHRGSNKKDPQTLPRLAQHLSRPRNIGTIPTYTSSVLLATYFASPDILQTVYFRFASLANWSHPDMILSLFAR